MSSFAWSAYAAPLIAGLWVPAALAGTSGSPFPRRLRSAAAGLAVLAGVLVLLSPSRGLPAAAVAASVGILAGGLHLALEALRVPPAAAQAAASLAGPVLVGSLFALGPVLPELAQGPDAGALISVRIGRLLALNPYAATAYSVLDTDLLTLAYFYSNHLAGYPYAPPRWTDTCLLLAVPGLLLGGGARLLRRGKGTA
jgi:hypothetical protein